MPAWTVKNFIRTPLLLLAVSEIAVLFTSVYVSVLVTHGELESFEQSVGRVETRAFIVVVIMMICLIAVGLYNFHQRNYFRETLVRVLVGFAVGTAAIGLISLLVPVTAIPKRNALVAIAYSLMLVVLLRYIFVRRVDDNKFRYRTLIYGAGERARAIADFRRKADRRGFQIIGSVPAPGDLAMNDTNELLVSKKPIDQLAMELGADEIVVAMDDRRGNLPIRELLNCKLSGINVIELSEFLERESGKIRIDLANPGWLIFSSGFRSGRFRSAIKRLVDIFFSVVFLSICWPLMLLLAIAIKFEDGFSAPVFYTQQRVGEGGIIFKVFKFRSMREDAEAKGQAVWATENDERITRVGRFLRKYRLDEIPQLLNVIRGDMSLVGPRPERPEFVNSLSESIPYYLERHTVRPGITGWAQVRYAYGSSQIDAVEKLQFDLYYVKNNSLLLDIMIILQTVEVVIWGKGAR